jgi:hypothetical protein
MEPIDDNHGPARQHTDREDENVPAGGMSPGLLRAISLVMVLALILAGSSVIIFNTDNGLIIVLLLVAIAAALLFAWGFRSRTGQPGADR